MMISIESKYFIRIFILLDLILILLLLKHFLYRRKHSPRKEQWYFIYLFSIYLGITIIEIYQEFIVLSEETITQMSYIFVILIVSAMTASGLTLLLKFKIANIIIISGWILGGFSIFFYIQGQLYEALNKYLVFINLILYPWGLFTALILLYLAFKTRLSPIIGLLLAIGFLGVYVVIEYIIDRQLRGCVIRFAMLLSIYLGVKQKLDFWEISEEEKIKRGIPVLVKD